MHTGAGRKWGGAGAGAGGGGGDADDDDLEYVDEDGRKGLERGKMDTRRVIIPDISIAVVGSPSPSAKWRSPTERLAPGT